MFNLFHRQAIKPPPAPNASEAEPIGTGLLPPQTATSLLATPRRQKLLEHIWQRTSLSRQQFAMLYQAPLERYAVLVQLFPASESHHHAYAGGMLDHGLEIMAYALKLRQSYLLPIGSPPEAQAAQSEAWTAATAYAALLHDIGKIAVDLHVEYADSTPWRPWQGILKRAYRFRYREDREYRLHSAATGLLYHQVLDAQILNWLSGYRELWAALLYVLAGQYEHAGVLGELVMRADRASVAQELGGDPGRVLAAPKHALQRKLVDGLRYLLKEELKINQDGAADGWLTEDALWLVSKTVSDKLRAHLLSHSVEGIPQNNTAVFNVLQEHGIALATPGAKAIWKATVTSTTGWSHTFTLLKLAPSLIWEADQRPLTFEGTVTVEAEESQQVPAESEPSTATAVTANAGEATAATPAAIAETETPTVVPAKASAAADGVKALMDLLGPLVTPTSSPAEVDSNTPGPAPGADSERLVETPRLPAITETHQTALCAGASPGEDFLQWLKQAVTTRKLIINDAKALVHCVADTVYLVSPGIFQRYAQEHPHTGKQAKLDGVPDWRWVQKHFEKLQVHRKQANGLNIWTCEVSGPRKSRLVHGYLLAAPGLLFEQACANNPYLVLKHSERTTANQPAC